MTDTERGEIMTDIAGNLKVLIKEKGITYTFISAKTGISIDALSRSFLGKRKLSANEMIAICKTIGVDLNDLI